MLGSADRARPLVSATRNTTTGTRVAVLGADVATDLFAGDSPIGQTIVIGDWPFLVVGVLNWVGDPVSGDASSFDRSIFVPFKACAARFAATSTPIRSTSA